MYREIIDTAKWSSVEKRTSKFVELKYWKIYIYFTCETGCHWCKRGSGCNRKVSALSLWSCVSKVKGLVSIPLRSPHFFKENCFSTWGQIEFCHHTILCWKRENIGRMKEKREGKGGGDVGKKARERVDEWKREGKGGTKENREGKGGTKENSEGKGGTKENREGKRE
jgi:hypothetical protein